MTVAFLSARMKAPEVDYWGKLKQVQMYLKCALSLKVDTMSYHVLYMDSLFATHHECKGHTNEMLTFGDRAVMRASRKQRVNMRSLQSQS